jgi:SRSO17 transposase
LSIEPMAARVAPFRVGAAHQSLHHFVAKAAWDDAALLTAVRGYVLPAIEEHGPIRAWIVDDTSLPKKGKLSVGVARQYCGQLGKQDNCQVAVALSVANEVASLPVAYRLYLPESWAADPARRTMAGVPGEVVFQSKPEIALEQLRQAIADGVPRGVVVTDAGYGNDTDFRDGITALDLPYVAGIQGSTTLWPPGTAPLPAKPWSGKGRPPTRLRRDAQHQPLAAAKLAVALPADAWQQVTWREGTAGTLRSRFAAVRMRPAHRDTDRSRPRAEEWLLVERPEGEKEPTRYWLSTLPATATADELVATAKLRWRIERDFEELKQELGLGHFEGRGWRGFHHHAALCIAAYGFLVAERCRFSPRDLRPPLSAPGRPAGFRPRGSPDPSRAARARLDRHAAQVSRGSADAAPASMPVLLAALPAATHSSKFMTR